MQDKVLNEYNAEYKRLQIQIKRAKDKKDYMLLNILLNQRMWCERAIKERKKN